MSITAETVDAVAVLARLDITSEERQRYTGQMARILDIMGQLDKLPTDGVEPMSHAVSMTLPERDDVVTNGDARAAMLANAPDQEQDHFKVPKVIE